MYTLNCVPIGILSQNSLETSLGYTESKTASCVLISYSYSVCVQILCTYQYRALFWRGCRPRTWNTKLTFDVGYFVISFCVIHMTPVSL